MQGAAQVSELEVPMHCRVAWLRKNYSYFEDEHREVLMDKLDALSKTSGKKVHCYWHQCAHVPYPTRVMQLGTFKIDYFGKPSSILHIRLAIILHEFRQHVLL